MRVTSSSLDLERYRTTIVGHYEACLGRHGDTHQGVDWPDAADAATRYEVMLGILPANRSRPVRLLDFGCGAAHLLDHMLATGVDGVEYTGLDLSPRYLELCRDKHPSATFLELDVLAEPGRLPEFDYAVLNGVFTEKRELTHDQMFAHLRAVVREVFAATRHGLALNVMSSHVDWERDDLFHLPIDDLVAFLTADVSRHVVVRSDYGLYEYTTYVHREPMGDRGGDD